MVRAEPLLSLTRSCRDPSRTLPRTLCVGLRSSPPSGVHTRTRGLYTSRPSTPPPSPSSPSSLAYAAAVLVESCIVIGLYYKTSESLLPRGLRWASRRAAAVGLRRVVSTGTGEELDAPTREVSRAGAHAPTEFSRRDANDC